jgi:hypothetical protein
VNRYIVEGVLELDDGRHLVIEEVVAGNGDRVAVVNRAIDQARAFAGEALPARDWIGPLALYELTADLEELHRCQAEEALKSIRSVMPSVWPFEEVEE